MEIRMVKLWTMVMLVMGVVLAEQRETDHNKEDHDRLCAVLRSAVGVWGSTGSGLTEPLKTALKNTIFGYTGTEETVEKLKSTLPHDYNVVAEEPDSRSLWCGQKRDSEAYHFSSSQQRWSGHSATHDMLCLCTAGQYGWPINKSGSDGTIVKEKLCGKDKSTLKGDENKGWGVTGQGKEQIQATWDKVVSECLKGGGEKEDLKKTLETFIDNLNRTWDAEFKYMYRLGEGSYSSESFSACTGSPKRGVCAMYYPETREAKTWWIDLKNAITDDEKIQEQKKHDEEAARKQQESKATNASQADPLTSEPTKNNQTHQNRTENLHEAIRKYNITSGTPIIPPSSWLLSALLLI